jgi:hypothetical protein
MRSRLRFRLQASMLAAGLLLLGMHPAQANWLTKLAREAGETGGKVGRLDLGTLDGAVSHISRLPNTAKGVALAAHVTPEGQWRFANKQGEVFTVGSPAEMGRLLTTLAPEAPSGARVSIYLAEDALFANRKLLQELPADAHTFVVSGKNAFSLRTSAVDGPLHVEVRPNVLVQVGGEKRLFEEAVFHLERPLNRSSIRVLALKPTGPKRLSAVPSYDPGTRAPLVDEIDPAVLPGELGKLRHQTVLLSGRVEGQDLVFKPANGAESRVSLTALARAAEASDVSLVVLETAASRQPGGRNWLWQTVSVDGLDAAMQRATFGDFLNGLAAGRKEFVVTANASATDRMVLRVQPSASVSRPMTDAVTDWVTTTASELMGSVAVEGVQAFVPDKPRTEELDVRLVPGIPSWVQFLYLGSLVAGLIGWEYSFEWWRRLWPAERREEYRGAIGYHSARATRLLAMLLLFLPLVGIPALIASTLSQLWRVLTAPFRFLRWLGRKLTGGEGSAAKAS